MNRTYRNMMLVLFASCALCILTIESQAQVNEEIIWPEVKQESDTIGASTYQYRPKKTDQAPEATRKAFVRDSIAKRMLFVRDSIEQAKAKADADAAATAVVASPSIINQDSLAAREAFIQDSLEARRIFVQDSLEARRIFVADSLEARRLFVQDSIYRRQRALDSLQKLQVALPLILEASIKTVNEEFILDSEPIRIVGDTILSDFTYRILPISLDQAYVPWLGKVNLSTNPINYTYDTIQKRVVSMQAPFLSCTFEPAGRNALRINERSTLANNRYGKFYKSPVDTVFFDQQGRVTQIKKYTQMYQATANYQRGSFLFNRLEVIKNYTYDSRGVLQEYKEIRFCDRWNAGAQQKVCNIATYTLSQDGNLYTMTRANDPVNAFADGVFHYEFNESKALINVKFKNNKNTENWETIIETNELGHVSRYLYDEKGFIGKTLVITYDPEDPHAANKVVKMTYLFEKDGVSYYQRNNNTGKGRRRDPMTGEWGPWE